jgi:predicted ATPase
MLFAISGSQGSGKSTVIKALEERGFPTVERKTSRSIMDEWGVTLSQVNNDRELTIKFQDRILTRKMEDEREAAEDVSRIYFTERTYADLFTYALVAVGKDNEYSDWLNEYYKDCCEAQMTYNANFYLPSGRFNIEHDGVRGSNDHYVRMVDIVMKDVATRMNKSLGCDPQTFGPRGPKTIDVIDVDIDYRIHQILNDISKYI